MPPYFTHFWQQRSDETVSPNTEFYSQLVNPGDVFSVLLLLGGDVVAVALAQLAGSGLAPVTFSFGWVGYSVYALMAAFSQNRLMPSDPDCKCKIINGENGYVRDNTSWILGRIMRDFEYWRDPRVAQRTADVLDAKWEEMKRENVDAQRPLRAGLIISIYEPCKSVAAGTVKSDFVYCVGFFVILLQLGIAAIPWGLYGDWAVLLITTVGTVLALVTGLLPQWKTEKWTCRTHSDKTYILTKGNGAQNAIVVLGNGAGFNLEDLASGQTNVDVTTNRLTRWSIIILFFLWIFFLIAAAGIKQNTWFLLAIGGIGIVQSIYVSSRQRRPENFGIPLKFVQVIAETRVMDSLLGAERSYENLGRVLLPEFFPGTLRAEEAARWDEIHDLHTSKKETVVAMNSDKKRKVTPSHSVAK
ncbi:hypothetical protein VHEMI06619 [[Torrubiella] hemipterigena]|uniref:Uncharacterized protein n=1 Tax=[Torrubiella] hemipterigena TaxID=1531966 RepID=A0A0A1T138_9HYPO|nr:hypothetical protein VHEMI06619 [[Torrubiella] hemipterigena]